MYKEYEKPIIGYPYPTQGAYYRVFDGERWHDCDRYGNIIKYGRKG